MPKVSIIVPVYNTEKYLHRCIDSILRQTLTDIEVILVDDGSPDRCPTMCDRFAEIDDRITVIHKINGGLSSARNAGMRIARGKYIGFVDSDDDIELNMFAEMVEAAEQNNADFVMSDYIRFLENGKKYLVSTKLRSGIYDKEDIEKEIYPSLIMGENIDYGPILSVWHCIYNHKFLRDNNIVFADDVKWSEDNLFSTIVGYYAKCFVYLKGRGFYHYYQNPGTITTSYRPGAWNVYKKMNKYLEEFFGSKKDYDFDRQLRLHIMYYACNTIRMECYNAESLIEATMCLKKILRDPCLVKAFWNFKLPEVSIRLKVQLWLMKHQLGGILAVLIRG